MRIGLLQRRKGILGGRWTTHPGWTQGDIVDWGRQVLPDAGADLDGYGGAGSGGWREASSDCALPTRLESALENKERTLHRPAQAALQRSRRLPKKVCRTILQYTATRRLPPPPGEDEGWGRRANLKAENKSVVSQVPKTLQPCSGRAPGSLTNTC